MRHRWSKQQFQCKSRRGIRGEDAGGRWGCCRNQQSCERGRSFAKGEKRRGEKKEALWCVYTYQKLKGKSKKAKATRETALNRKRPRCLPWRSNQSRGRAVSGYPPC